MKKTCPGSLKIYQTAEGCWNRETHSRYLFFQVVTSRCSGRFATGTIAADTTRLFPGAKRLTTSGFSRQRPAANKFAAALLPIRGDYV